MCGFLFCHKYTFSNFLSTICLSHGRTWAIIEVTDVSHLTQPMLVTVFCLF